MQPVPSGVPGELYIGGSGLADGYINCEALTANRFVSNPFDETLATLYRTGDLVRQSESGDLEFMGRVDNQIKLRGYRIELEEIEKNLLRVEGVSQCAVKMIDMPEQDNVLVAYVIADSLLQDTQKELNSQQIVTVMQEYCPSYMIPSFIIPISDMPLTRNGKVDRLRLPDITNLDIGEISIVLPSTETEMQLVELWKNLLITDQVSVRDSFFSLGGSSLSIIKMVNTVNHEFDVQVDLSEAFKHNTIEELAQLIEQKLQGKQQLAEDMLADLEQYTDEEIDALFSRLNDENPDD
jgi:acyl carrier protein